jgi:hypothetical protein
MYPRPPAHGRHNDTYRPPTDLPTTAAVAAAFPLTLFALTEPAFLVGALAGVVAGAATR